MKKQFIKIVYFGHRKGRIVTKHISTDAEMLMSVFLRINSESRLTYNVTIAPGISKDTQKITIRSSSNEVIFEELLSIK